MTSFEHNAAQPLAEGVAVVPSVLDALRLQPETTAPPTLSIKIAIDEVIGGGAKGLIGTLAERAREAYDAQADPQDLSGIQRLSRTALGIVDDTRWQVFLAYASRIGESKAELAEKAVFRTEVARRIRQMPDDAWENAGADALLGLEQLAIREHTESGLVYEPLTPLQQQENLIAILDRLNAGRQQETQGAIEAFTNKLQEKNDPELLAAFHEAFGIKSTVETPVSAEQDPLVVKKPVKGKIRTGLTSVVKVITGQLAIIGDTPKDSLDRVA